MLFGSHNISLEDDETCRVVSAEQRWQYTGSDPVTVDNSVHSLVSFRLEATHLNCCRIANKVAPALFCMDNFCIFMRCATAECRRVYRGD